MATLQELVTSDDFRKLDDNDRRATFDVVAASDEGFRALKPETQAVIRRRMLEQPRPAGPVSQAIQREFVEPYTEYGKRVGGRLSEAGEAVLAIPSIARRWIMGDSGLGLSDLVTEKRPPTATEDALTVLRAVGAPFEPIMAPLGEAAGLWAERATGSPTVGEVAKAGTEIAAGVAAPFVRTPATPTFQGLSKVGLGRAPEEVAAAERAAANMARGGYPAIAPEAPKRLALPPAESPNVTGPARTFEAAPSTVADMPPIVREMLGLPIRGPEAEVRLPGLLAEPPKSPSPVPGTLPTATEVATSRAGSLAMTSPTLPSAGDVGAARAAAIASRTPEVIPPSVRELPGVSSGGSLIVDAQTGRVLGTTEEVIGRVPDAVTPPGATSATPQASTPATSVSRSPGGASRAASPSPSPSVVAEGEAPFLPPIVEQALAGEAHRKIAAVAENLFSRGRITRDPNTLLSDQIMDAIREGQIALPDFASELKAQGLDLATFFRGSVKNAASRLAVLSNLARKLNVTGEDAAALADLAAEVDDLARGQSWWQRVTNVWRATLVSRLGTALRNATTQAGRLGLDTLEKALDAGLQRTFAGVHGYEPKTNALDGFETLLTVFQRGNKTTTDTILEAFPKQHDRLFGQYLSDVAAKTKQIEQPLGIGEQAFRAAEKGAHVLNIFNRAQEFAIRRGVFVAKLDQALRQRGLDLTRIVERGAVKSIPEADIKKAVETALEMTWGAQPQYGTWAADFIRLVNKTPGAALAIPFPRFMANALRFQFEYSPFGALKLLSAKERAAWAAGDTKTISRSILGTGMFLAAYEFRSSEHAGERWYEARVGDKTIDLRAYNPFASYIFAADVVKRAREGRLDTLSKFDIAQGLLSTNMRAGTGVYLLDQFLSGLTTIGDWDKFTRAGKELAGEATAGFLTPLTQLQDVLAQYDDSMRVYRDTRQEPFLGPIKARIPGVAETLPEARFPTRSGPMLREDPLLREVPGVLVTPRKNPLEAELDRLGFRPQEIFASSGNPEYDRLVKSHMGGAAERILVPLVQSKPYQSIPKDSVKAVVMHEMLSRIGTAARRVANGEAPDLAAALRVHGLPPRIRKVISEIQMQQGATSAGRGATLTEADDAISKSQGDANLFESLLRSRGINPDAQIRR